MGLRATLRKINHPEPTRKQKTYKSEFYSINSILGNQDSIFYLLLGGRQCGKSYAVMDWAIKQKLKKGDQCKFYWCRLTESALKNLLANNADKLVDPDLKRKYHLNLTRKNTSIYSYTPYTYTNRNGKEIHQKKNVKEFCELMAASTFYNNKGVGFFDKDFTGQYIIVLDEFERESSEKNSFDIVYNFTNMIENLVRNTKTNIKVFMCGNTLDEASDLLAAFNFIPDQFGRYKLKSKRCVIDYIAPNEQYKKMREGSIANILMPGASTFTNEVQLDHSILCNKRLAQHPVAIIKFSKDSEDWFTVWNNNIIKQYNKETLPQVIAMRRYLDSQYDLQLVKTVFDIFDSKGYLFTNLATFKRFQKQLRLLKKN